jgi:hypothetical protein
VADLSHAKAVDLRRFSSCWLSAPLTGADIHFRHILCFEPGYRGRAAEVVGDIFRSIIPLTSGPLPISQIAMPLVASGDEGERPETMLEALLDASIHWLSLGLSLDRIKIVLRESADVPGLRQVFTRAKRDLAGTNPDPPPPPFRFDLFVSYSQRNKEQIDVLVGELRARRPSLRVFVDRLELRPGAAWQQHIFEALDASRKVVCALSPD